MSFKNPLEGFNQDARIQDPRALWHVVERCDRAIGRANFTKIELEAIFLNSAATNRRMKLRLFLREI